MVLTTLSHLNFSSGIFAKKKLLIRKTTRGSLRRHPCGR
jgi:hypothetical protein